MKKYNLLLLCLFLIAVNTASAFAEELVIFAAASLTEGMEDTAKKYAETNPGMEFIFNFDSSGTLKTQIEEGAVCDLFISAAQKQMNQLEELELILPGTRVDLLENRLVLAVSEGNPAGIRSFEDLADRLKSEDILLALGNSDVPAGAYGQQILAFYGIDSDRLNGCGCVTYGSNVKELTSFVSEGLTDCGIIYETDALAAGLEIIDTASEEQCEKAVYPAAVLSDSAHPEKSAAFLNWLQSDEASDIFTRMGFTPAATPEPEP